MATPAKRRVLQVESSPSPPSALAPVPPLPPPPPSPVPSPSPATLTPVTSRRLPVHGIPAPASASRDLFAGAGAYGAVAAPSAPARETPAAASAEPLVAQRPAYSPKAASHGAATAVPLSPDSSDLQSREERKSWFAGKRLLCLLLLLLVLVAVPVAVVLAVKLKGSSDPASGGSASSSPGSGSGGSAPPAPRPASSPGTSPQGGPQPRAPPVFVPSAPTPGISAPALSPIIAPAPVGTYSLLYSTASDRSGALPLEGAQVSGKVYIFLAAAYEYVQSVQYMLNNEAVPYAPSQNVTTVPFDFAGVDPLDAGYAYPFDADGVYAGGHTASAVVTTTEVSTATRLAQIQVQASFNIVRGNVRYCAPVQVPPAGCPGLIAPEPLYLDWSQDRAGKVQDQSGLGLGFLIVENEEYGQYLQNNLLVDRTSGALVYTTTAGDAYEALNSQDNRLGYGIAPPDSLVQLRTIIRNPPVGEQAYEQAGLWFGVDQDNYIKVNVVSTSSGQVVEILSELGGTLQQKAVSASSDFTSVDITLELLANPFAQTVTGSYWTSADPTVVQVAVIPADPRLFSFDGAIIDPTIGTTTFGGIYGTHSTATTAVQFQFLSYTLDTLPNPTPPSPPPPVQFSRTDIPLTYSPTGMVFFSDKLYVCEYFGNIHIYTFDSNWNISSEQIVGTLYGRLTLGIEVDPSSTDTNVMLWVSSSVGTGRKGDAGLANSGVITKLSGANFATRNDYITGLPRSMADHAVNNLHFGPDGLLYFAIGSNTNAGGANDYPGAFLSRPEQVLSGGLFYADVLNPSWDPSTWGACSSAVDDTTGIADTANSATCQVSKYANGIRNMFDFVFHSNGHIYGGDNGKGVAGVVPSQTVATCQGLEHYQMPKDPLDPGDQPDLLHDIVRGANYGHPNPALGNCVFYDGSFQKVSYTNANYTPPMQVMGNHISPDGVIEYTSDKFCGQLKGHLLFTGYSLYDNVLSLALSADGTTVESTTVIATGFQDPLPIRQSPDGTLFVGSFNQGDVNLGALTILVPNDNGC
eukprot:jgi/Chlat1/7539/Chrsp62S07040